jgi:uncharacterized protein
MTRDEPRGAVESARAVSAGSGQEIRALRRRCVAKGEGLSLRAGGLLIVVLLGWSLISGCGQSSSGAAGQGSVAGVNHGSAQPRLRTIQVWLGAQELTAEVARAAHEREKGMMFRTNIAEDEGMLFVFPRPGQVAFWMKNVPIPLSCAYIDPEGVILELHDLEPHEEETVKAQSYRIQYVLETARGWFERHGIGTGTVVRTEQGTLQETFGRVTR